MTRYCFIHIPRTAGTAFGTSLADGFRATGRSVSKYSSWDEYVAAADLDSYDLTGGHTTYQAISLFKEEPLWITMLGEPVNRTLSHCTFLINLKAPLDGKPVQSLDGYLFSPLWERMGNNLQTRMLGADFSPSLISTWADFELHFQPTEETLELAKQRLEKFFFVGIKEQLLESIDSIGKLLNLELILPKEGNRCRPHSEGVSSDYIDRVKELNQLDLELYEFGLRLFEERENGKIGF